MGRGTNLEENFFWFFYVGLRVIRSDVYLVSFVLVISVDGFNEFL